MFMNTKCLYRLANDQWVHYFSNGKTTVLRHFNEGSDGIEGTYRDQEKLTEKLKTAEKISLADADELIAPKDGQLKPSELSIDEANWEQWRRVFEFLGGVELPLKPIAQESTPVALKKKVSRNIEQEQKLKEEFERWSDFFKNARPDIGNVERVIEAWKKQPHIDWLDREWKGEWGYRKNSLPGAEEKGEKRIEGKLLGKTGTLKLLRLVRNESEHPILTAYHNLPLSNMRRGQVISDALGVVLAEGRVRPLLIEVKVEANNPWYALVECLQQVRLARAGGERICTHLGEHIGSVKKGAWGIVVASDRKYFTGDRKVLDACKDLLAKLKEKTEARVGFAFLDERDDSKLIWIAGNWD
jgi:hypothetical protein